MTERMKAKTLFKKLVTAHSKYQVAIGALEGEIADRVEFDFSILYQPSDGFVILDYEKSGNALLSSCLWVIEEDGKLTREEFSKLRTS